MMIFDAYVTICFQDGRKIISGGEEDETRVWGCVSNAWPAPFAVAMTSLLDVESNIFGHGMTT